MFVSAFGSGEFYSFLKFVALIFISFAAGIFVTWILLQKKLNTARKDAIKRSRAVLGGQAGEQLAPYLPGFPCNPGDARFVGKPVDYVAFVGASEGKPIQEILLIEIKTGQSNLSTREKEIKTAVEKGRVRYVQVRL